MEPLLKWPGGKRRELSVLRPFLPPLIGRYVEPFVGGGALFFDQEPERATISDLNPDLISFYHCVVRSPDRLRAELMEYEMARIAATVCAQDCLNGVLRTMGKGLPSRLAADHSRHFAHIADARRFPLGFDAVRIASLAARITQRYLDKVARANRGCGSAWRQDILPDRLITAFQSALYTFVPDEQETGTDVGGAARFFCLREFCFGGMFRANGSGAFNVPYAGRSYDNKNFVRKVLAATSEDAVNLLRRTSVQLCDFQGPVIEAGRREDDFVFLDPPYDCRFASYGPGRFGEQDHRRLFTAPATVRCKMLLVTQSTPLTRQLVDGLCRRNTAVVVDSYRAKYAFSIRGREHAGGPTRRGQRRRCRELPVQRDALAVGREGQADEVPSRRSSREASAKVTRAAWRYSRQDGGPRPTRLGFLEAWVGCARTRGQSRQPDAS